MLATEITWAHVTVSEDPNWLCVCVSQRSTLNLVPLKCYPPCFLKTDSISHWPGTPPRRLGWLAHESRDLPVSTSSELGLQGYATKPGF